MRSLKPAQHFYNPPEKMERAEFQRKLPSRSRRLRLPSEPCGQNSGVSLSSLSAGQLRWMHERLRATCMCAHTLTIAAHIPITILSDLNTPQPVNGHNLPSTPVGRMRNIAPHLAASPSKSTSKLHLPAMAADGAN